MRRLIGDWATLFDSAATGAIYLTRWRLVRNVPHPLAGEIPVLVVHNSRADQAVTEIQWLRPHIKQNDIRQHMIKIRRIQIRARRHHPIATPFVPVIKRLEIDVTSQDRPGRRHDVVNITQENTPGLNTLKSDNLGHDGARSMRKTTIVAHPHFYPGVPLGT